MGKQIISASSSSIILIKTDLSRYQVNFKNIYGYNLTLIIDRCKKVGLTYNWVFKSYQIHQINVKTLLKQLNDIKSLKINGTNLDFCLINSPDNQIKRILSVKSNNYQREGIHQKKEKAQRILLLDNLGQERLKFIQNLYQYHKIKMIKQKKMRVLLICFELKQMIWQQKVFKGRQFKLIKIGSTQIKRNLLNKQTQQLKGANKQQQYKDKNIQFQIFILNYQLLHYAKQNLSFKSFFSTFNSVIIDDSQVLVQSDLYLNLNNQYFEVVNLILQNHSIKNQLIFIYSQLPQIKNLIPILIILQPKTYGGLKFCQLNNLFNKNQLNNQQNILLTQAQLFLKRRYKNENKTFREIMFLLKQTVLINLNLIKENKNIKHQPNCNEIQISLKNQVVQKFKIMDKKYKKYNQQVNLKKIIQNLHDSQQNTQFQIVSQYSQHLMKKQYNNYLIEARQLMLHQKIQVIRNYITYYNSLHLRVALIVQDQQVYKIIKKLLNDAQIRFIQYTIKGVNFQQFLSKPFLKKWQAFRQFNDNFQTKFCLINRKNIIKQYHQVLKLAQANKKNNQLNIDLAQENYFQSSFQPQILIPKITSAHIIIQIDAFWFPINQLKEKIIHSIFEYQFQFHQLQTISKSQLIKPDTSFYQSNKQLQVIKKRPSKVYFICKNSYEKMLIQKFKFKQHQIISILIKKQQKYKNCQKRCASIKQFSKNLVQKQSENFKECQQIDYIDIDEEYDKIESMIRKSKVQNKDKVFLPKYTQTKSFKQLIQQKQAQLIKNVPIISQLKLQQNQERFQNIKLQQQCLQNNNWDQPQFQSKKYAKNQMEQIVPQFKLLAKRQNLQPEFNSTTQSEENSYLEDKKCCKIKLEQSQIQQSCSLFQSKQNKAKLEYLNIQQNKHLAQNQKLTFFQTQFQAFQNCQDQIQDQVITQNHQSNNYIKQYQYFLNQNSQSLTQKQTQPTQNQYQLQKYNSTIQIPFPSQQNIQLQNSSIQIDQLKNQKRNFKNKKVKSSFSQNKIKNKKSNLKMPTNIIIDDQVQYLDEIEAKTLKPRQIYQKAVSKSKRLWEKKIKKNRERIICKQKLLSVDLVRNKSILLNQVLSKELLKKLKSINQELELKDIHK